jgi:regulator of sigma D
LKFSLLRGLRLQALENFLREHVDYFASELAEILRDILPKHQADAAEDLANNTNPPIG